MVGGERGRERGRARGKGGSCISVPVSGSSGVASNFQA